MVIPTMEQCEAEVAAGNVYCVDSGDGLSLFNYKPVLQYGQAEWNDVNRRCRGLIFDSRTGERVAVPFPKFFNVGEKPETDVKRLRSLGRPRVFEKLDGSLGILYRHPDTGKLRIATRGSFTSPQSAWANRWLDQEAPHGFGLLDVERYTYLFEILCPESRVVVDYSDRYGLAMIGKIDKATGAWMDWTMDAIASGFDYATFSAMGLDDVLGILGDLDHTAEGYVLVYPDGTMAKAKGAKYLRLHRVVSGLSPRRVFELLRDGSTLAEAYSEIPDEFYEDAKAWERELLGSAERIVREFGLRTEGFEFADRKGAAIWAKHWLEPHELPMFFANLDGKDIGPLVWKAVERLNGELLSRGL